LVNTKGELIGINTAIASETGSYVGYSFAVPSNLMKKVIEDFKSYGEVQRGYLGVSIQDVDNKIAEEKGLSKPEGVLVGSLSVNSAGGDAGIKEGDIITKIDGKPVNSVSELQVMVAAKRPGDHVNVSLIRNGKDKDYDVVLRNKEGKTPLHYAAIYGYLIQCTKAELSRVIDSGGKSPWNYAVETLDAKGIEKPYWNWERPFRNIIACPHLASKLRPDKIEFHWEIILKLLRRKLTPELREQLAKHPKACAEML